MYTEEIENLLNEKFQEEGFLDCFLIEIVQKGKKTEVFIDSDSGMDFGKCHAISRYLEAVIDEKAWFGLDYILEVSSPGLDRPLKFPRQYKKNIGRKMKLITLTGEKMEGILKEADDNGVLLFWEEILKDSTSKKKIKKEIESKFEYKNIKEAKIQISI